jgi:hypothetical protein
MANILPLRARLSLPEIESLVTGWQQTHPELAKVQSIGVSGGHPIWAIELTDQSVPNDDKEVTLVLAMHTGMEISGGNAVFILGKWLLSGDPVARRILRNQVVVLVPCPNPYSYEKGDIAYQFRNELGGDIYAAPWSFDGVSDPVKYPEAEAVKTVIDAYAPDFIIDSHGVWYEDQIMIETNGVSAFGLFKSYNRSIVERVMAEAEAAGYPQDNEDNRQTLLPVDTASRQPEWKHHFQNVKDGCTPGIYAYNKYHTIVFSIEVAFEESGFLRMKKLLEIGTERAPLEYYPGYPNRTVNGGLLYAVAAWGRTAEERRRSRVELWDTIRHYATGLMHPEMPGKLMYVCAMTAEGRKLSAGGKLNDFIDRLQGQDGFDAERLRQFAAPDPGFNLAMHVPPSNEGMPPEHGLAIKIRIPYREAELLDVSLNGNPLHQSDYDGYIAWKDGNWTMLLVPIPPRSSLDLAVVTVSYNPRMIRRQGVFDV